MGDLVYENQKFLYMEGKRERVLLDCRDLLSNKSRIPMHCLKEQELRTIPLYLAELMEKESRNQDENGMASALLDVLLAARLIRTSQPVRVLEYGCLGGKLSWHLASVMGAFHEASTLVCACDRMDDGWLAQVADVEKPPRVSFLAGDYGQLPLAPGFFDIVLINGAVDFADPARVLLDARKLAARGGILICWSEDAPLLRDTFRLFFERDQREEYEIDPFRILMTAKAADQSFFGWEELSEAAFDRQVQGHLRRAEEVLAGEQADPAGIAVLKKQLLADAKEAAARGDGVRKARVMEVRERLETGRKDLV